MVPVLLFSSFDIGLQIEGVGKANEALQKNDDSSMEGKGRTTRGEAPGGKSTHKTRTEKAISRLLNSLILSLIQETEAAGTQTKDRLPQCAHC